MRQNETFMVVFGKMENYNGRKAWKLVMAAALSAVSLVVLQRIALKWHMGFVV